MFYKMNNRIMPSRVSIVQFMKFCMVGLINTGITLFIIFLLMKKGRISYEISNGIGYVAGFITSFLLNKKWTFKGNGLIIKEGLYFLLIFFICYSIQFMFLKFFIEKMFIKPEYSQIYSMLIYTGLNFFGNKYITFGKRK